MENRCQWCLGNEAQLICTWNSDINKNLRRVKLQAALGLIYTLSCMLHASLSSRTEPLCNRVPSEYGCHVCSAHMHKMLCESGCGCVSGTPPEAFKKLFIQGLGVLVVPFWFLCNLFSPKGLCLVWNTIPFAFGIAQGCECNAPHIANVMKLQGSQAGRDPQDLVQDDSRF